MLVYICAHAWLSNVGLHLCTQILCLLADAWLSNVGLHLCAKIKCQPLKGCPILIYSCAQNSYVGLHEMSTSEVGETDVYMKNRFNFQTIFIRAIYIQSKPPSSSSEHYPIKTTHIIALSHQNHHRQSINLSNQNHPGQSIVQSKPPQAENYPITTTQILALSNQNHPNHSIIQSKPPKS